MTGLIERPTPVDPGGLSESPVHTVSRTARWSTVNAAEALPGCMKPAVWSMYDPTTEIAQTAVWASLGALPKSEIGYSPDGDRRFFTAFFGRAAINIDRFRSMADAVPGTSGDAFEEQMLGRIRSAAPSKATIRRYPVVAVKAPVAISRARKRTRAAAPEFATWRRNLIARLEQESSLELGRESLREAMAKIEEVMLMHLLCTMAFQGGYDKLVKLAKAAGKPGLETLLIQSPNGTDELRMVSDQWKLSRGAISLEAFLDDHGYHGTNESHIDARVWREDPAPVLKMAESFRGRSESEGPDALARNRRADHERAVASVLAVLPARKHRAARKVIANAGVLTELREVGKSLFLQVIDGGRAAARAIGVHLVANGVVAEVDDVYYLTVQELVDPSTERRPDLAELIALRRRQHAYFESVELPAYWEGAPAPQQAAVAAAPGTETVSGLGVSPGVVTGRVSVMADADDDFEEGDVLVCHTSDPTWTPALLLASALVVDIGGTMSHAAIVSRELGIPCVINTGNGTTQLRTGDVVRIDGSTGSVDIVEGRS